jgi:hypothetical protein
VSVPLLLRAGSLTLPSDVNAFAHNHRPFSRPRFAVWTRGVAIASLLVSTDASGAFELNDATWQGSSALLEVARGALGKERVVLAATLEWGQLRPGDALLVLHPESSLAYEQVSAFMAAGGRVALLDDYGMGSDLLSRFHIQRVAAPTAPGEALRGNANLPIAAPTLTRVAGRESGRHPIVEGVNQVMTNHPSALSPSAGVDLTSVLEIPSRDGRSSLFALIGVIGDAAACGLGSPEATTPARAKCGRLFAMADPSVFINLMMRYPGNRRLAAQLVQYLVEDDAWGKRGGKLYVLTNRFHQSGRYANAGGLKGALGEYLSNLKAAIDDAHERGLPRWLAFALAVLACAGIVAWTGTRAGRAPRRTTPRYAMPPTGVAQAGLPGRAAVLTAPTTHRALAVVELKLALEEQLRQLLGLGPEASTDAILNQIRKSGALGPPSQRTLEATLNVMRRAETAVMSSEQIRMTARMVAKMHRHVLDLLEEVRRRTGGRA